MPSVTSLKWWISDSIEPAMMVPTWSRDWPSPSASDTRFAGQAILRSAIVTGPGCRASRHCSTIFSDSAISSTRMR